MCVCVCVCVYNACICEYKRKSECVCVRERESESEKVFAKTQERAQKRWSERQLWCSDMNNTQASHAKWEGKMKIGSENLCIGSLLLSILLPMFYHANALPDKK